MNCAKWNNIQAKLSISLFPPLSLSLTLSLSLYLFLSISLSISLTHTHISHTQFLYLAPQDRSRLLGLARCHCWRPLKEKCSSGQNFVYGRTDKGIIHNSARLKVSLSILIRDLTYLHNNYSESETNTESFKSRWIASGLFFSVRPILRPLWQLAKRLSNLKTKKYPRVILENKIF